MNSYFKNSPTSKLVLHLLFWTLSLVAIGTYFTISNTLSTIDYIYSAFFNISLVVLVYINLRLLIPAFLKNGKYLFFLLGISIDIGIAILIHDLIFDWILPLLPLDFYLVSFTDKLILVQIFAIYLTISTLLYLSDSWFKIQHLQQEKLQMELGALRAQINPHFLFNGLNSIYAMALKGHKETPTAILKLSDLLRYSLYEVGDKMVSIDKEIDEIQNYIDIQKLRLEKGIEVKFTKEGDFKEFLIAPMLLLPILENAFKHGPKGTESGFIHVSLTASKNKVIFTCENSFSKSNLPGVDAGGIGLKNLLKRLELLYPGRHDLSISSNDSSFVVTLKLHTP